MKMGMATYWTIRVLPITGEPVTVPGKKPPPDQYNPNIELIELTKLLTVSEQTLATEHLDTLQSSHSVAVGFYNLGRFEYAVRLCEQTLEVRQRVLGSGHPDMVRTRDDLDIAYRLSN